MARWSTSSRSVKRGTKAEMWGKRAIAKVGINWDKGYDTRVAVTFAMSSAAFFTFLPLAITQSGGGRMTALWIVLAVLSFWIMYACFYMMVKYSGRSGARQLRKINNKLEEMNTDLSTRLDETNTLLRKLVEGLDRNGK